MTSLRIMKAWNLQPELEPIAEYQSAKLPSASCNNSVQLWVSHLLAQQTRILTLCIDLLFVGVCGRDSCKGGFADFNS